MKNNCFKFTFLILGFLSIGLFDAESIPKEFYSQKSIPSESEVLKNISELSDNQLYEIAKKINDDALPGESDYAQILLTEAIRKNPKNVNALLEAARTIETTNSLSLDKLQKQFGFVYQAFMIEPNNPKIRYKFAELLLALDQKDLFKKIYSQTIQEFPNSIETKIEKIQILSKTDPKQALELSDSVLKSGGDILDFLPDFLAAVQKIDREENFSKNLRAYSEKYSNRWLWYQLGLQYLKEQKLEDAQYAFQKSVSLGNIVTGRLQLGIVQYHLKNRLQESIQNFKIVLQILNKNPFVSGNIIYFTHIQLARALMISEKSGERLKQLNFISKYSFQNHEYFTYLLNEYLKNGHEDILEEPMKIAIQNDPLFSTPYIILANIFKKQKNEKLAREFYEKYMILNAKNPS